MYLLYELVEDNRLERKHPRIGTPTYYGRRNHNDPDLPAKKNEAQSWLASKKRKLFPIADDAGSSDNRLHDHDDFFQMLKSKVADALNDDINLRNRRSPPHATQS